MNVLVTGASGFLGRSVAAELLRRGHAVRALVRPSSKLDGLDRVDVARGDLEAPDGLDAAIAGVDAVIHLAAGVRGTPEAISEATVSGTKNLLEALSRSSCRRLILAGSLSACDWSGSSSVMDERTPIDPDPSGRDAYARAKIEQEQMARDAAAKHGWGLTVIRPGFLWGPGNVNPAGLGQKLGGPLFAAVAPSAQIPLCFVDNAASMFADALESPKASGLTFHAVDGHGTTTRAFLRDRPGRKLMAIPVPYALGMSAARLAYALAGPLREKLPGLLVPSRFRARFRPLEFRSDVARETLGWKPLGYGECLARTRDPGEPGRPRA